MAEVAGVVIGIVPIVLECLKSYRSTRERLESFRNYTQVISDIQLRLRIARASFRHSCQLLLENVVDSAHLRSEMIKDPQHKMWQEESLDRRFRIYLEHDYETFEDIFDKISENLREAQTKMKRCLAGPENEPAAPSTIAERFKSAFHVSRRENRYGKWLNDLDEWNERLNRLLKQRLRLMGRHTTSAHGVIRKAVPQHYIDVGTTAQRLYDTLHDSWSCTNISHTAHQAKLALDAEPHPGGVQLDIVIACSHLNTGMNSSVLSNEFPVWLYVKSTTTYEAMTALATVGSEPAASAIGRMIKTEMHGQTAQAGPSTTSISHSCITGAKRKLRLVQLKTAQLKNVQLNIPQDDDPVPTSVCDNLEGPNKSCPTKAVRSPSSPWT